MKAIVLAAGKGSRLMPLTDQVPKCLIQVHGKPILEHQLRAFQLAGITDITIVIGYLADKIIDYCTKNKFKVNFILNEKFSTTNNMFSLFLTKNTAYNADLIICNGDVVFSPNILIGLLGDSRNNIIAVDVNKYLDESMKVMVTNGIIRKIDKKIDASKSYGCSIDLYRFSADATKLLFEIMDDYINTKKAQNLWTECAIQEILTSTRINIFPYDINNQSWVEIDNQDDLLEAEKLF